MINFITHSPKAGLMFTSGLGINLSFLFLLPWSWNSVVTLMMTAIVLKLCYNRHAVKKHTVYDAGLMAAACFGSLILRYVLIAAIGMTPSAAGLIAPIWAFVMSSLLFIKITPQEIKQEFALGYKPKP